MIRIDANNYIKRIYHSGQDPYELFLNLIRSFGAESIEVVCDTSTSRAARREIYPDYKKGSNLVEDPVYFTIYSNIINIACHFSNITVVEVTQCEADDYIMGKSKPNDTVISNDKDLWPLVGNKVRVLIAGTTKVDRQLIETKFHYPEPELIYVNKALVGDSSDKIKGKKGFGKAAYAKLSREDCFYLRNRFMGDKSGLDECLNLLADDESAKLSWTLVNQLPYKSHVLGKIMTPLQDFLDETGIQLLEDI